MGKMRMGKEAGQLGGEKVGNTYHRQSKEPMRVAV